MSKSYKELIQHLNPPLAAFRKEAADTMSGFDAMSKAAMSAGVVSALDKELSIPGFKRKVKQKDVAILSRQLATMVNSGLTLVRALMILEKQADNPLLSRVVADVRTRVEQGSSLVVGVPVNYADYKLLF